MKESLLSVFLAAALISGLISVYAVPVSTAQPGLVVIIASDTTWTKAGSPVNLTGPTVVNAGVTLTINPGVTVYQNGYTLYVNGTLKAIGTVSDKIQIFNGAITISGPFQPSSSSVFENVVANSSIISNKLLTLINSTIRGAVTAGVASTFTNNAIVGDVEIGSSTSFTENNVTGDISMGNFCLVSNNTIVGDTIAGNSTTVTNNTINGGLIYPSGWGGIYTATALTVGSESTITNNIISGGVRATSSTISDNVISGGGPFTDWVGRPEDSTSAIMVSGASSTISNNSVSSTAGYGILIQGNYTYVSGNTVKKGIRVAGNALIENNIISNSGTGIQVGRIYISAFNEMDYGFGNSIIRHNTIVNNSVGIGSSYVGGTALIERNLISNNSVGIDVVSQTTILNNTIANSSIAIHLYDLYATTTINYNNIINYNNSVFLTYLPTNINATFNWWGSTNAQAFNLTIHDFKFDINLGTVNFVPFLTQQNPSAFPEGTTPNPPVISEFTPTTYLPLLITVTLLLSAGFKIKARTKR